MVKGAGTKLAGSEILLETFGICLVIYVIIHDREIKGLLKECVENF